MQRLLSIALSCLFAVALSAQEPSITYPYNPDSNTDSLIAVPDILDLLGLFGNEFIPEPVMVDGVVLTEWLEQNSNNEAPFLECVDMGISPECFSNGLGSSATLTPNSDGFTYSMGFGADYNDGYIPHPHWRKFQIHNLTLDQGQQNLCFKYLNTPSQTTSITCIEPEVNDLDEIFFYVFAIYSNVNSPIDCVSEAAIGTIIPINSSINVLGNTGGSPTYLKKYLDIYLQNEGSLSNTGVLFNIQN